MKMNTSISSGTGTSMADLLKKKMLDKKEEVEKVKEQIQDMNRKMQVETERREYRETALVVANNLKEKLLNLEDDLAMMLILAEFGGFGGKL